MTTLEFTKANLAHNIFCKCHDKNTYRKYLNDAGQDVVAQRINSSFRAVHYCQVTHEELDRKQQVYWKGDI